MSRERSSVGEVSGRPAVPPGFHPAGGASAAVIPAPRPARQPAFALDGAPASDPNFMMSLARGLQVTRALSARKRPSTVSQLSIDTGLSRAVVRRCLHTLTQLGCTGCDDRRHFFLLSEVLWGVDAPSLR
jgi:IclR family pca regulon transcriptional regulator